MIKSNNFTRHRKAKIVPHTIWRGQTNVHRTNAFVEAGGDSLAVEFGRYANALKAPCPKIENPCVAAEVFRLTMYS
jgi:hypothetical protein